MLSSFKSISIENSEPTYSFPTTDSFVSSSSQVGVQTQAGAQTVVIKVEGTWVGTLKVYLVADVATTFPSSSPQQIIKVDGTSSGAVSSIVSPTSVFSSVYYVAQLGPGSVYVVCTHYDSGTVNVSLATGPATDGFDVTVFGALGDGVNDDDVPIQTAIYAAYYLRTVLPVPVTIDAGYNVGASLYFPPGTYIITATLIFPSDVTTVNVRFQGYPSSPTKDYANAPRSILCYSAETEPMIRCNPAAGFALQDLGLSFSQRTYSSGTGMIDLAGIRLSSTVFHDSGGILIENCTFYPSSTDLTGCDCYLYLDGCETVVVSACAFSGADYAIQGLDTLTDPDTQNFANGATIGNQTRFRLQHTAPILNPGNSWSLNGCVVEPNASGLAAFVRMSDGRKSNALSIIGCWMGDNRSASSASPETWIEWVGNGLLMTANHIEIDSYTTGLKVLHSAYGSHGIVVQANEFYNAVPSGAPTGTPYGIAVDFGTTTEHDDRVMQVTYTGNYIAAALPVNPSSTLPTGYIFSTTGVTNCDGLNSSGDITAPTLAVGDGALSSGDILGTRNGNIRLSNGNFGFTQVTNPAAPTELTNAGSGGLAVGIYRYRITFVTASGETALGAYTSFEVVGSASKVTLKAPAPYSPNDVISHCRVYRTKVGPSPAYYQLPGTVAPLGIFTDDSADSSLTSDDYSAKDNTTAGIFYLNSTTIAGGITGFNTWAGIYALGLLTGGTSNSVFGSHAGASIKSGSFNSIFGSYAGYFLETGGSNSFFGVQAGYNMTSGSFNMLVGGNAGYTIDTGSDNLCIGYKAGYSFPTSGLANLCLGAFAGPTMNASYSTAIGYSAAVGASYATAIGPNASVSAGSSGNCANGTAIGPSSSVSVGGSGSCANSTAIGPTAVVQATGNGSCSDSTAIGYGATIKATNSGASTGSCNNATAIGYGANVQAADGETCNNSTAIGYQATVSAPSGSSYDHSTAIGSNASVSAANTLALGGTGSTYQNHVVINGTTAGAQLQVNPAADATIGVIVKGYSSGTAADLQRWEDSSGTTLASVDASGSFKCAGLTLAAATKSANYTIATSDYFVEFDAGAAAVTATLPSAVGIKGRQYVIFKHDSSAYAVTVAAASGEHLLTIGGNVSSYNLSVQGNSITIISNGTQWVITAKI